MPFDISQPELNFTTLTGHKKIKYFIWYFKILLQSS